MTDQNPIATESGQPGGPRPEAQPTPDTSRSAILSSANLASIATDLTGVIQNFSAGAERMLGYRAAEVLHRLTPADLADPEEVIARATGLSLELGTPIAPGFETLVARASRGIEDSYELTWIRKDGRRLPTVVSVLALRDREEAIDGYLLIGTDNTGCKQAEAALRRSQQHLRDFIDGLGPSMFAGLLTPEGILIEVNRPALAAAGLQPGDVLGKPFADSYWWNHSREVQQQLREAIVRGARGEASRYDVQVRAADNHLIDIDFSLQPLRDEDGEVEFLIPSASVTTEREQAGKALRESNEKFRLLADNITDAFWIRSPDMRELHYISPAFERIWGRSAASLYADPGQWSDFTVPEDRDRVLAVFAGLTGDAPSLDIEYRIVRPEGEIRWVRVRGFQVRDAEDKLIRLTGIVTDITEKKRLESQSLRAQRMESIGTLAGGIAHDLNNVLAPILMSVAMLKEVVTDEDGLSSLATMEGSARRGAELVKQVLSFARGVEGQRITVNPLHLMRDLLKAMRDTFPKSIDVGFAPAPDLWTVTGDPTQMHQVFLNLCVNARDAMPHGGSLSISMANVVVDDNYSGRNPDIRPGPYVMVRIEDTGTGISPKIRDRIFEPFFTTKGIGKGTGLGLSTTMGIVKSHGGFINLYSEAGEGTTFTVYLPANTTVAAADQAVDPTRVPHGTGELILMVDDEEAIRSIGKRMLERYGYRVLLASEGAEGLSLYARYQQDIALVLTDMAMPIMDGPALITALMALNPRVRIIGCSGLTSASGIARALGAGIQHFVPKPYTAEEMLTAIHGVLSGPEQRVKTADEKGG